MVNHPSIFEKSLVIGVRRLHLYQFNISDSSADGLRLRANPKPGLRPTPTLASERKRVIIISSPSMLQSSSHLTGILLPSGLVTSLLLDLSLMRHTHTYGYSGFGIDGQIPGRILDVGDDSKLSNSEIGHLGMVKGEKMTMNQRRW
jgi:hypothetical protein